MDNPIAARVAANVKQLRKDRGLKLSEVAGRVTDLGRPMSLNTVSKIERGERQVSVDDLVALAIALDVSPNRLLLTPTSGEERVELTRDSGATAETVWRWATGEHALPVVPWGEPHVMDFDRIRDFRLKNRPHDPPDTTPASEVFERKDVLDPVVESINEARRRGLSIQSILAYVKLVTDVGGTIRKQADKRQHPDETEAEGT